tara:strand:+ start:4295 stop:6052 length:1758 start_codon:yes stop_codon:yes gene_type:complete
MKKSPKKIDPIILSLVQNRLDQIAINMGWVMIRSARSPIFNQSHDFSCFITDSYGNLISQADGIPIHTGGGGIAIRALLARFANQIYPGDIFLLNDPYEAGGNHLPDYVIARPVFCGKKLIAFSCNRAHQSDIGGGAAGTYNPEATEIFHEGLRIPPIRLSNKGKFRKDIFELILLNSRCSDLMEGDLFAMMGSTEIGSQQIQEIAKQYGLNSIINCFDGILNHADQLMREAILAVKDGEYKASESFENDCFDKVSVKISVKLIVKKDTLTVDFNGTSNQIKGFKNSSLANTHSAVYTAIASFFDHSIPRNEGTFRSIVINAPLGTLVNAKYPAPVTMCTVFPAHEIIHACWWALGQAVPKRSCAGWGKNSFPNASGNRSDGSTWVMYNWGGLSGAGAVNGRDGFNQIGPLITLGGLTIPSAESYERLYPVQIIKQEFRCDASGTGKFRGGTGIVYEAFFEKNVEYSFRAEGLQRDTGRGVLGGFDGKKGNVKLSFNEKEIKDVIPPDYGLLRVQPNKLKIISPAGGGYGNPYERDLDLVLRDIKDEIITIDFAKENYGVILENDCYQIDIIETNKLREKNNSLK